MKKITKYLLLAALALSLLPQRAQAAQLLIPGGQVVGLALENQTVTVAAFDEDLGAGSRAGGLAVGDEILSIDGQGITSAEDVHRALTRSRGSVRLEVRRNGKTRELRLTPEITDQGPRLGVYLRQGVTGIGTVTFYDPAAHRFGALGHGVNAPGGGLFEMNQGSVYPARVVSVRKGQSGKPGQLIGALESRDALGSLSGNTSRGVFGALAVPGTGQPLPVGEAGAVHTGPAAIRSTIAAREPREYSVEILKIYPKAASGSRNLLLQVTDPALLEATGGIVQGMSGSPIIQDGKLIGAVTHVLVNDPTTGYGIFIENMLDAAA